MEDSYGRKVTYLRFSLTDRCNLFCKYCNPDGCLNNSNEKLLTSEEVIKIVKTFSKIGINKVRYTGGEPLLRDDLVKIVSESKRVDGIDEIALTTNGILLDEKLSDLKNAGVEHINISLDTLSERRYKEISKGKLDKVLKGIDKAFTLGIKRIKINVVLIKGFNDDEIEAFCELTRDRNIHVRFIELMPMGEEQGWIKEHYLESSEVLRRCGGLKLVEKEYRGAPALLYSYPGAKGKVGIINPLSNKFCDLCNRIRITSSGKLKACLHSESEIDLRPYLDDEEKLLSIVEEALGKKPKEHRMDENVYLSKTMVGIGG